MLLYKKKNFKTMMGHHSTNIDKTNQQSTLISTHSTTNKKKKQNKKTPRHMSWKSRSWIVSLTPK